MVQQQRITVTLPKAALRKMRANGSDCRGMQLNKCWWRSTWRYLQINKGKNNMANGEPKTKNGNSGNLGFEAEMFKAADKLRGSMEPSDYRHVALGLSFLKYIPMPSRRGVIPPF